MDIQLGNKVFGQILPYLITVGVGGTGEDHSTLKMRHLFLCPYTLALIIAHPKIFLNASKIFFQEFLLTYCVNLLFSHDACPKRKKSLVQLHLLIVIHY